MRPLARRRLLTAVVGGLVLVASACASESEDPPAAPRTTAPSTPAYALAEASENPPAELDLPPLEKPRSTPVEVEGAPAALVGSPGALWVQSHRGSVLTRLDPRTGEVTAASDVGVLGCGDLTVGGDSVWITGCGVTPGLVRVDLDSAAVVSTTPVTGLDPTVIGDDLWISHDATNGDWEMRRLDLAALESGGQSAMGEVVWSNEYGTSQGVVALGGSIWAADTPGALVYRLDPDASETQVVIPMPGVPGVGYLVEHDGAPWYVDPEVGNLVRIDPATNEAVPSQVWTERPSEYWGVAVSTAPGRPGRLWVRYSDDEVWLVDTRQDRVVRRIRVAPGNGGDVQQVGDTLFVSSFALDRVEMIPLSD